ncbi:hypothetical protein GF362_03705 [Candidatus Dojkabacteria bacterium]|nr:hypothetical protein [Candidatus Dojkabacteria bacterium]
MEHWVFGEVDSVSTWPDGSGNQYATIQTEEGEVIFNMPKGCGLLPRGTLLVDIIPDGGVWDVEKIIGLPCMGCPVRGNCAW